MASGANSDDEELALALRLSQLSSDDFDEQLPTERLASANHTSCPCTPTSDEKDDLALALRLSRLSSNDFDEQVARLHRTGSASTSKEAPNESDEDDLE
jgi:hypothetical protein